MSYQTSEAAVDSNACSFYVPGFTISGFTWDIPASATTYIHSCDGSAPTTNGYTYEYTNLELTGGANNADGGGVLTVYAYSSSFSNFEIRKGAWGGGILAASNGDQNASNTYNNIIVRDGAETLFSFSGGSTVTNMLIIDSYLPSACGCGGEMLAPYDNVGSGLNFTDNHNIIQQDQNVTGNAGVQTWESQVNSGTEGAYNASYDWLIGKNNAGLVPGTIGCNPVCFSNMTFDHIYISGNSGLFALDGPSGGAGTAATVSNSVAVSNGNLINFLWNNNTLTLTNNKFCVTSAGNGIVWNGSAGTVTGNKITSSGNLYFLNNTLSGADSVFYFGSDAGIFQSNSDDFGSNAGATWRVVDSQGTGGTWTTASGTPNIYEAAGPVNWILNGTTETTLAGWKALSGVSDPNSVTTGGSASSACTALPTVPNVQ